jgi:hypothetical protein
LDDSPCHTPQIILNEDEIEEKLIDSVRNFYDSDATTDIDKEQTIVFITSERKELFFWVKLKEEKIKDVYQTFPQIFTLPFENYYKIFDPKKTVFIGNLEKKRKSTDYEQIAISCILMCFVSLKYKKPTHNFYQSSFFKYALKSGFDHQKIFGFKERTLQFWIDFFSHTGDVSTKEFETSQRTMDSLVELSNLEPAEKEIVE